MDALRENNFIIYKNHFSDDYSTRNSLNSLLAIDQELWKNNKQQYFSGKKNTPFFDILKINNYKIFTGFHDSHFGPPGNHIDGYFTFRSIKLSDETCSDPEQFVFEVYVFIVVVSIASEKVTEIDDETNTEDSESEGEDEETVGAVVSGVLEVVNPVECV